MKTNKQSWPQEKIDRFVKMWTDGVLTSNLAKEFECSRNIVWRRANALGLPPRADKWTREESSILQKLWEKGVPIKIIAFDLNRSTNSIKQKAERLGLPGRKIGRKLRITVYFSEQEYTAMRLGAHRMRTAHADYIRHLIRAGAAS